MNFLHSWFLYCGPTAKLTTTDNQIYTISISVKIKIYWVFPKQKISAIERATLNGSCWTFKQLWRQKN